MPDRVEKRDAALLRPLPPRFTREAATTAQLRELEALPRATILRRLKDCKEETLVALARWWNANGDEDAAWEALKTLTENMAPWFSKNLTKFAVTQPAARDEAAADVAALVWKAALSLDESDAFWECRFWVCLQRKASDIVSGYGARSAHEFAFAVSEDGDSDTETINTTQWLSDGKHLSLENEDEWRTALESLPVRVREVFFRTYYQEQTQEEIAVALGITARTVRQDLTRAAVLLRPWREETADDA